MGGQKEGRRRGHDEDGSGERGGGEKPKEWER